MYLKVYLKALISGFNELFELFGKVQSILTAIFAVLALFFTANFTAFLEPVKPYYPKILIAVAFFALFISSYRAWLKLYVKTIIDKPLEIVAANTRSDLSLQSSTQGVKLNSMRLHLTFLVSNRKNHSINVKQFDIRTYLKDLGLNPADTISSNPATLPMTIESNEAGEFNFSCAIDLRSADFKQQLEIIKSLPNRSGLVKTYIYSIDGVEIFEIPIEIDNSTIIRSVKNASPKFDQNVIELVLGA